MKEGEGNIRVDMSRSRSDQTWSKYKHLRLDPPKSNVNATYGTRSSKCRPTSDQSWQNFWPKHSVTSEAFFRYNAKPSPIEDKTTYQEVPENIVIPSTAGDRNDTHPDALTLYLEKEKQEKKLRPKVNYSFFKDFMLLS